MINLGTKKGMLAKSQLYITAHRHGLLEQPDSPHPEAITEVLSRP